MNNSILQILWLTLISFFCSFAKSLNDYAKLPKRKQNFLLFVSEVLLSGICGVLTGILCIYLYANIYIVLFCGGLGGLLGLKIVKVLFRLFMTIQQVNIEDIDLDDDIKDENNNKKNNK